MSAVFFESVVNGDIKQATSLKNVNSGFAQTGIKAVKKSQIVLNRREFLENAVIGYETAFLSFMNEPFYTVLKLLGFLTDLSGNIGFDADFCGYFSA